MESEVYLSKDTYETFILHSIFIYIIYVLCWKILNGYLFNMHIQAQVMIFLYTDLYCYIYTYMATKVLIFETWLLVTVLLHVLDI